MSRSRSPNRDKAFELFIKHKGKISPKEIAAELGEKVTNIRTWKNKDKWESRLPKNKGGAPKGNLNNLKHGNYCSVNKFMDKGFLKNYIPKATRNIISGIAEEGISTLDMLWDSIVLCYTGIIRSQNIMHVTDKKEMIKELKKSKTKSKSRETEKTSNEQTEQEFEYEFQFAWDRQDTFIKSQSKAFKTLNDLIKSYEELLHKNWDMATEEQRVRIDVLKSKLDRNKTNTVLGGSDKLDSILQQLEDNE